MRFSTRQRVGTFQRRGVTRSTITTTVNSYHPTRPDPPPYPAAVDGGAELIGRRDDRVGARGSAGGEWPGARPLTPTPSRPVPFPPTTLSDNVVTIWRSERNVAVSAARPTMRDVAQRGGREPEDGLARDQRGGRRGRRDGGAGRRRDRRAGLPAQRPRPLAAARALELDDRPDHRGRREPVLLGGRAGGRDGGARARADADHGLLRGGPGARARDGHRAAAPPRRRAAHRPRRPRAPLAAGPAAGTPIVFLDRPPGDIEADTVLLDNVGGARQAVEHLVAHGHARIAYVSDAGGAVDRQRAPRRLPRGPRGGRARGRRRARPARHAPRRRGRGRRRRPARAARRRAPHRPLHRQQPQHRRRAAGAARHRRGRRARRLRRLRARRPARRERRALRVAALGRQAAALAFARLDGDDRPPQTIVVPTELVARGSGERRA